MSDVRDRWPVALLGATALGAWNPRSVPVLVGALAVLAALRLRRWLLLVVAAGVLASGLGERARAGLEGVEEQDVAVTVTLLTDPRPVPGDGLRAEVRWGRRRLELRADNVAADALAPRLAGDRVQVRGTVSPLPAPSDWSASRHLAGRLRVLRVEAWAPGHPVAELANGLRRTLVAGAGSMHREERSLFTGLVVGDDRHQSLATADDFDGAGLTHLLAVSGQNVAFLLALASPVLRRLRLWPRAIVALGLIGLFATVTRFEPSIVRASAMAALALVTTTAGRPLARIRVLALALTLLLLVDPLLVRSVGFQLSAAATAAIVVAAAPLERVLPGPGWLRTPLAVTAAAQLGVAPILVATFGPLPVASLPANLLAVPAAGLVMAWGLTGGLVAGALVASQLPGAGGVAAALHLPTRLLLAWVAEVARRAAALPLGHLKGSHLVVLASTLSLAVACRRLEARSGGGGRSGRPRAGRARPVALAVAGTVLLVAALSAQAPVALRSELLPGVVRWHAGGTDVVVLGGVGGRSRIPADELLAQLREGRVGTVDLVVLADPSVPSALLQEVAGRHPVAAAVVHGADPHPGAQTSYEVFPAPRRAETVRVGRLEVTLTPTSDRIVVEARRGG